MSLEVGQYDFMTCLVIEHFHSTFAVRRSCLGLAFQKGKGIDELFPAVRLSLVLRLKFGTEHHRLRGLDINL